MTDLHSWITAKVDEAERAQSLHREDCASLPQARSCCGDEDCFCGHDDTFPCDCGAPAAVLRRCEADRRILARHRLAVEWTWQHDPACHGCGTSGDCDDPVTENLNDCPELLDLAHAHGLTPEILASLDRPEPPPRKPDTGPSLGHWLNVPTQTTDVPPALRGPNWKADR